MNIGNELRKWLDTCPYIDDAVKVDIDRLDAEIEALGLYKQPSKSIEKFIDGSMLETQHFYFLVRRSSQLRQERVKNQDYLSKIENWIEDQDYIEHYPLIDNVHSVGVVNSFYLQETNEEEAIYQVGIALKYLKERK